MAILSNLSLSILWLYTVKVVKICHFNWMGTSNPSSVRICTFAFPFFKKIPSTQTRVHIPLACKDGSSCLNYKAPKYLLSEVSPWISWAWQVSPVVSSPDWRWARPHVSATAALSPATHNNTIEFIVHRPDKALIAACNVMCCVKRFPTEPRVFRASSSSIFGFTGRHSQL